MATTDGIRKVGEKQAEAVSSGRVGRTTEKQDVQSEIALLLSQKSLAERPSF